MKNIEGNSDANGSLDKAEPYMQETYPQMFARLEREMAERAVASIAPEAQAPTTLDSMPENGSFA